MPAQIVVRGFGSFGDVGCVVTKGYACEALLTVNDCVTTCTNNPIRNNRITILAGTIQHKDTGENTNTSVDNIKNEYKDKFDDPRYYGREL